MSDTLYVTPAQVLAAKLALELSEEAGEVPDEALKAIANAQVVAEDDSAFSEKTGVAASAQVSLEQAGAAREGIEQARHANPVEEATDQAASILNQAQQLADSMIDEAMQSARDLLLTARAEQRNMMEQAQVTAQGTIARATANAERAGTEDPSVHDVEYIRMFAKVAQVQFQAVLDALNEHVARLGESPAIAEPLNSDESLRRPERTTVPPRTTPGAS